MSYTSAETILPKELLELVQQYVDGQILYIPKKEKCSWGESTDTKKVLELRNNKIYHKYMSGSKSHELAQEYHLSEKSIQRIIRNARKLMSPESRG